MLCYRRIIYFSFRRLLGVRSCESKCLFSGSRGEVCVIEPLHVYHTADDHPIKDVIILAMCSLSKVSRCPLYQWLQFSVKSEQALVALAIMAISCLCLLYLEKLPVNLRSSETIATFCKKLKTYFFETEFLSIIALMMTFARPCL